MIFNDVVHHKQRERSNDYPVISTFETLNQTIRHNDDNR